MSGSIWKKEFSLRKKDEETAAEEAHVAAPSEPVAAEPVALSRQSTSRRSRRSRR